MKKLYCDVCAKEYTSKHKSGDYPPYDFRDRIGMYVPVCIYRVVKADDDDDAIFPRDPITPIDICPECYYKIAINIDKLIHEERSRIH